jgi:hypothetical protein
MYDRWRDHLRDPNDPNVPDTIELPRAVRSVGYLRPGVQRSRVFPYLRSPPVPMLATAKTDITVTVQLDSTVLCAMRADAV